MSAQVRPQYTHATSISHPVIFNALVRKYGYRNVVWPIVVIKDDIIAGYIYERTAQNQVNDETDKRPVSQLGKKSFFLNYLKNPRIISPYAKGLEPFISNSYRCSYDYIINSPYSTVDIDYAWKVKDGWTGIETTTFWVEFVNEKRAEDLICKIRRRPSWRGPGGAHATYKIVDAASELNITIYMACINTIGKISDKFKTDGNVYWFPLSHTQINRLLKGLIPHGARFDSFNNFINWL